MDFRAARDRASVYLRCPLPSLDAVGAVWPTVIQNSVIGRREAINWRGEVDSPAGEREGLALILSHLSNSEKICPRLRRSTSSSPYSPPLSMRLQCSRPSLS